jgi:hypothetical protein
MPRGRGPKRVNREKRKRVQRNVKKRADERRARIREEARANQFKGSGADVRTGGTSTGRESGIMASQNQDKIKSLEQSIGSLDRRIENALKDGNLDLVKDLRSRQNKFTTQLGNERAIKAGGVLRDNSGRIVRTGDGSPVFNNKGLGVFNRTKDMDFLDPTRKLQNEYPEEFAKMYPITNRLNRGLPGVALAKQALGIEDKPIAYTDDEMPGVRYPLDVGFGAGEGEPFFGGRSRDPDFDSYPYIAPVEPVTISDLEDDKSVPFTDNVVPYQFPIIDPNQRTDESNKMADIIDSGTQDFATLDKEFQADNERIAAENALLDAVANQDITDNTIKRLQGSGYNLDQNTIDQLFLQGFLEPGRNYFPNPRVKSNNLVDQALQSYYQTLQQ